MSPYPIAEKAVIAVASSALFNLRESHAVFEKHGTEAYRQYQRERQTETLPPGVAFAFVRRLLALNGTNDEDRPVEVVLLSRNDPDTGMRVFHSIAHYGLPIERAAFLRGRSPYRYINAFNACLFLSANEADVREAIRAGHPAGLVLGSPMQDDMNDDELRIAFDFDGVLADDEAERVYQANLDLKAFHAAESARATEPHGPGPLHVLLRNISQLQAREFRRAGEEPGYEPRVRVAIITARGAPSHERMINTLRDWGIQVDETFFLGGVEKTRILEEFAPHIFFDDQRAHLDRSVTLVPSVHVPFGVVNEDKGKATV